MRRSKRRIAWALLLKRVFKVDVTTCSQCGGDVRELESVSEKEDIERKLLQMGLPVDPPELHPARAPAQGRVVFDDVGDRNGWRSLVLVPHSRT